MKQTAYFRTSLGMISLTEEDGYLVRLDLHPQGDPSPARTTPLLEEGARQLREYLAGERRTFDLPLRQPGTSFQQKVWQALADIPYGEVRSYGQIAAAIGRPKACRAVGGANHQNQLPIFLPCHRVVGADGSLTGYGGGLAIKKALLELERNTLENERPGAASKEE